MTTEDKEALLTKEDLDKVSEHRFYFTMSLRHRIRIRRNMQSLKKKHDISLSDVFRKVMLKGITDADFVESIKKL